LSKNKAGDGTCVFRYRQSWARISASRGFWPLPVDRRIMAMQNIGGRAKSGGNGVDLLVPAVIKAGEGRSARITLDQGAFLSPGFQDRGLVGKISVRRDKRTEDIKAAVTFWKPAVARQTSYGGSPLRVQGIRAGRKTGIIIDFHKPAWAHRHRFARSSSKGRPRSLVISRRRYPFSISTQRFLASCFNIILGQRPAF